jgi:hypothetical protein
MDISMHNKENLSFKQLYTYEGKSYIKIKMF